MALLFLVQEAATHTGALTSVEFLCRKAAADAEKEEAGGGGGTRLKSSNPNTEGSGNRMVIRNR